MAAGALAFLGMAIMVVAMFLIPLGVPGLWIMIGVLVVGVLFGTVSIMVLGICIAIAAMAELLEFLIVKNLNTRYGGSPLAFWGAIAGGIAGVIIGMPVPVIGSVIAGFLGSFAGAMAATLYETKKFDIATRVGWGVLIGRMWSAAAKVAAGVVILVLGAAALLF